MIEVRGVITTDGHTYVVCIYWSSSVALGTAVE